MNDNEKPTLELTEAPERFARARPEAGGGLPDQIFPVESPLSYRALIENMLHGFAYCRMLFEDGQPRDFVYLEVNRAFERLTGLHGAPGRRVSEVIPGLWQSNPELFEIYGRVAATGQAETFETYVQPLGIWCAVAVYSPAREYFIALFDNITPRKQAEAALRESEMRYRVLVETSPEAIFVGCEGRIVFINPAGVRLLGAEGAEQILGQPALRFIHPDDREYVAGQIAKGGPSPLREERFLRLDGTSVEVEATATPITFEGRRGALVVVRDITQRKKADAALRASEERLRLIAETIEDVFWIMDVNLDHIFYISPAYEQIWGRSCASLYQNPRSLLEVVHPEDRVRVAASLEIPKTGRPFAREYRLLKPDGSLRWIADHGFPVPEADGRITRYVGVARDITENKALQQQFLRAQRLESIGRLAGGVAHDLNNVLAPILMSLEILRGKYHEPDDLEVLENLESSAKRGAGIVKQVLTFARGVEGERVPLQLRHLLRETAQILAETFPKSITVTTRPSADLWLVSGNATHLHQVLMNLCVNARDAMPHGGSLILAAANLQLDEAAAGRIPGARPGSYVLLRVVDSGTGIPPENLDRIFEPFFTTKGPEQGTGLGLSTVLGIVKSHGGFIQVESRLGQGTEFKVYLPALPGQAAGTPPQADPVLPRGQGEMILLVEDEESISQITRRVLLQHGYRVLVARDGVEGVALYAANRAEVRLVLTDLAMPNMSGETMIRILQKLEPTLRIIVASGHTARPPEIDPSKLGAQAFLAKPYTSETLLTALQQVLPRAAG